MRNILSALLLSLAIVALSAPVELPWKLDFENETAGQPPSGWQVFSYDKDPTPPEAPVVVELEKDGGKALQLEYRAGRNFGMGVDLPAVAKGWAKVSFLVSVKGPALPRAGFEIRARNPGTRLAIFSLGLDDWSRKPTFFAMAADFSNRTPLCACEFGAWYRITAWVPGRADGLHKALVQIQRRNAEGTWDPPAGREELPALPSLLDDAARGLQLTVTGVPGAKGFTLLLDDLTLANTDRGNDTLSAGEAPEFVGETGKPALNVFIPGERVPLTFSGSGLPAGQALSLKLKIVDEQFRLIEERELPLTLEKGRFTLTTDGPNAKLGFYRVYATLSTGAVLPSKGSRGEGFLTYAIVPDPAQRQRYPMALTHFGMQGGWNGAVNALPYLGARWVNAGPTWGNVERDRAGQYAATRAADRAAGKTGPATLPGATHGWEWCTVERGGQQKGWTIFPLMCLYNPPDWAFVKGRKVGSTAPLTPEGEAAWAAFCREAAKTACEDFPELEEHVYQITWEPNWFNGSVEQFLAIYRIAHTEIHALDPKAVIAGPTMSTIDKSSSGQEADWFKAGLGKHLDAYSLHPYITMPCEEAGYPEAIRAVRAFVQSKAGRELPLLGTEQGCQSFAETAEELPQARNLVRANLIGIGEGLRLNFGFYLHDYGLKGRPGAELGYGYYYNLRENGRFGTDLLGPKPIVPAYAALTWLFDGATPALGPVNWLGETVTGYSFLREGRITLALWDYGPRTSTVGIPVGNEPVEVLDWMGNRLDLAPRDGTLSLSLTGYPLYIRGLPESLWGAEARRPLVLTQNGLKVAPGATAFLDGSVTAIAGSAGAAITLRPRVAGLTLPEQTVLAGADGTAAFRLPLAVPAGTPPGRRQASVTALAAGGVMLATVYFRLDVEPPLVLRYLLPTRKIVGKEMTLDGLDLVLSETQGRAQSGTVAVTVEGLPPLPPAKLTLKASGETTLHLAVPGLALDSGRSYPAKIAITTNDGTELTESLPLGCLRLPQVDSGPATAWDSVPEIPLEAAPGQKPGRVQVGWTAKELRLRAELPVAPMQDCTLVVDVNADPGKVARFSGNAFADKLSNPRFASIAIEIKGNDVTLRRVLTSDPNGAPVRVLNQEHITWKQLYRATLARGAERTVVEAVISWGEFASGWPAPGVGTVRALSLRASAGEKPLFSFFGPLDPAAPRSDLCPVLLMDRPSPGKTP